MRRFRNRNFTHRRRTTHDELFAAIQQRQQRRSPRIIYHRFTWIRMCSLAWLYNMIQKSKHKANGKRTGKRRFVRARQKIQVDNADLPKYYITNATEFIADSVSDYVVSLNQRSFGGGSPSSPMVPPLKLRFFINSKHFFSLSRNTKNTVYAFAYG